MPSSEVFLGKPDAGNLHVRFEEGGGGAGSFQLNGSSLLPYSTGELRLSFSWCLCALVVKICIECHAGHFSHESKPAESKKLVEREPRGSRAEQELGGDDAEASGFEVDCRARASAPDPPF